MSILASIDFATEAGVGRTDVRFVGHHDLVVAKKVLVLLDRGRAVGTTSRLEFNKLVKASILHLLKRLSGVFVHG